MTPLTWAPAGTGPAICTAAARAIRKPTASPAQASNGATGATMPVPGIFRKASGSFRGPVSITGRILRPWSERGPLPGTRGPTTSPRRSLDMLVKILIALAVVVAGLVVVIALQPADFRVSRSATIAAPAPVVF